MGRVLLYSWLSRPSEAPSVWASPWVWRQASTDAGSIRRSCASSTSFWLSPGFCWLSRWSLSSARTIGAGDLHIVVRHILPNVSSPVVILATLGMGSAVVAESTLSFLGMGVPPPAPSWGWTLAFGTRYLRDAPHIATFSGLAIMATVLGFNLLGDGVRDLLDPRFRPQ